MSSVMFTSKVRISQQSPWVHRGDVEELETPLLQGRHGIAAERFMARFPHRPPIKKEEEHPMSQDYLIFAVGG